MTTIKHSTTQILSVGSMCRLGSWGILSSMAVFPGSLIPKVQFALFECPGFKENTDSLWDKLKNKARNLNPINGDQIVNFITNLHQHHKMLLLSGGLQLPFDNITANSIKRCVAAAVGKMYEIRKEKLHELGAPWLSE